jgi:hypothetical protein
VRALERRRKAREDRKVFKSFGALWSNTRIATGSDAPGLGAAQPRPTPESVSGDNRPRWVADIDLPWPVSTENDKAPAPSHVKDTEK